MGCGRVRRRLVENEDLRDWSNRIGLVGGIVGRGGEWRQGRTSRGLF